MSYKELSTTSCINWTMDSCDNLTDIISKLNGTLLVHHDELLEFVKNEGGTPIQTRLEACEEEFILSVTYTRPYTEAELKAMKYAKEHQEFLRLENRKAAVKLAIDKITDIKNTYPELRDMFT